MPEQTVLLGFILAYLKIFFQDLRFLNLSIVHFSKSFTFTKQMIFKILYLHKVAENYWMLLHSDQPYMSSHHLCRTQALE